MEYSQFYKYEDLELYIGIYEDICMSDTYKISDVNVYIYIMSEYVLYIYIHSTYIYIEYY